MADLINWKMLRKQKGHGLQVLLRRFKFILDVPDALTKRILKIVLYTQQVRKMWFLSQPPPPPHPPAHLLGLTTKE